MNDNRENNNMNQNTKIEVAREIMNFMIGQYGRDGYDRNNEMLMQVLADEKALKQNDFEVIDKILNVYGPMVAFKKEGN
ncbi:MAG: hypothetical protein MJ054_01100 [Clostridia bacterium]|nr:hypothetical protein [Clostridia bacterium]